MYFLKCRHRALKVTLMESEKNNKKRTLNLWTSPSLDPNISRVGPKFNSFREFKEALSRIMTHVYGNNF